MKLLKNTIIAAIHFSPSPGYKGFDSVERALAKAQTDLDRVIDGGVDAVIFENNYDLPHKIYVGHETTTFMTYLITKLRFKKQVPFGVSVLWNDYESALSIAKVVGAEFIRIPAFVDTVKTQYGIAKPVSEKAVAFRKRVDGENIDIYADVQVKHAEMIDKKKTLELSVKQATSQGAGGIIITGKWTGDAPNVDDIKKAKEATNLPIIVGSGADSHNVTQLFKYANAVIVSTSLKYGKGKSKKLNPNLKSFDQRMDVSKIKAFVKSVKK